MRLHVLDCGLLRITGADELRGFPAYLIETDDGERILVDTGWPERYGVDPQQAIEADGLAELLTPVAMSRENLVPGQLATLGLTPADLDLLILTHSDPDHIGGIALVPLQVPVYMSRAERALERPRFEREPTTAVWPDRRYELLDGDVELRPGLRVLATPGHTPGHISLLLTLANTGPVLLTIDAVRNTTELEERAFDRAWDAAAWHRSAERIAEIARHEDALVIFGHDAMQWPTLRKAPQFYD